MSWISMLLPDSALPLVVIGLGLAVVVGLISRKAVASLLAGVVILPVLAAPFVEGALGSMPGWVSLIVLLFVGLAILRALAGLLLGRGGANHLVGSLSADFVRFLISLVFLPFWMIVWLLRAFGSRRG